MMTVRETPFAFISSKRVSGVASLSGTRAPSANGYLESCFQTCTCGSMIRYSVAALETPAALIRSVLRERSVIDRLLRVGSRVDRVQFLSNILHASIEAVARTHARVMMVNVDPTLI